MKQSIYWWWKFEGKYLHKTIINGIKNLIKWFPIIWKDRNFDHFYIFNVLRFKIKNTADYVEKHDRYEGCELDVQKMRLCVKLIDLVNDEFYESEIQDYYKTKHTSKKLPSGNYQFESEVIEDNLDEYFKKYPNDFRRLSSDDLQYNKYLTATKMGMDRQIRANKILFNLIERNIFNWWD